MSEVEKNELALKEQAKEMFYTWLCEANPSDTLNQLRRVATLFLNISEMKGTVGYRQYHRAMKLSVMLFEVVNILEKTNAFREALQEFIGANLE